MAIVTGLLARKGCFETLGKTIFSGVILALTSAIVASPIVAYLFGGVTGAGSAFLVGYLLATGKTLLSSVFTSQILSDGGDKILSAVVVFLIIRNMSEHFRIKFKGTA